MYAAFPLSMGFLRLTTSRPDGTLASMASCAGQLGSTRADLT
jgi:hypothetical protein